MTQKNYYIYVIYLPELLWQLDIEVEALVLSGVS